MNSSTLINFYDGAANDELAQNCERTQGCSFLYTGKNPEVGQRVEMRVQVDATSNTTCRLSGVVTQVGELPTFDQWVTSSQLAPRPCECTVDPYDGLSPHTLMRFDDPCLIPNCFKCKMRGKDKEITLGTFLDRSHKHLGTITGQEITAYAYLHFQDFYKQDRLPFTGERIYKVILKADDSMQFMWCVKTIQDVTDVLPIKDLPQIFRDWEIGRQAARVAPFNLTDSEKAQWRLERELEWAEKDKQQRKEEKRRGSVILVEVEDAAGRSALIPVPAPLSLSGSDLDQYVARYVRDALSGGQEE